MEASMNIRTNSIVTALAIAGLFAVAGGAGAQYSSGKSSQSSPASSAQSTSTKSAQSSDTSAAVKPADKTFLTHAAMGGEAEVELGTLAQQKASDAKVKELGQRMETDHKKANEELRGIITAKGLTVPGGPDKMHETTKARLEKLQGAAFDQAYATEMVNDHMKDIKEFETASKSTDPAIKEFATKTLPTLREHLKMAQDAKASVGSAHSSSMAAPGSGSSSGGTKSGGGSTTSGGAGGSASGGGGSSGAGGTSSGSGGTSTGRGGAGTSGTNPSPPVR